MTGKIVKGIAGFYYVNVVESGIYECKAKGIFRKDKMKPLVGDDVEIEVLDENEKTGNLVRIFPRKNQLIRPASANVDQAMVIFAVRQPDPNYSLLDRFLIAMEQQQIPTVICFNKQDLGTEEEVDKLKNIYSACGYQIITTSAQKEEGIRELKKILDGKTTVVAGPSGVGKSSLTNLLQEEICMETGEISKKYMEENEEIEVVLADREEVKRILKEENVALICAYMMMHFLHDEEPFGFLK